MKLIAVFASIFALSACQSLPPSHQAAPVTKTISVNGTTLTYEEQGTGIPVVFLHGAFADHRIWAPQREPVASKYRFVALTFRYFGTAPWPDSGEQFSHATHVADVAAFIRALNAGPVILVGRSYGAYTALVVALRHPELVRGLVLNEPPASSLLTSSSEKAVLAADVKEMAPIRAAVKDGNNNEATRLFADWTNADPGGFDALPPSIRRINLDNARTVPLQLTSVRYIPVSCEQLGELKVPVLVTKGDLGRPFFKLIVDAIHRCVPGSQIVVIKGARHGAPVQQPVAFNEVLLVFLSRY